jgi:DNA-binding winged helix-turn-helix (wHTH) protein
MFELFRVDVCDERLWRGEDPIHVTNKAFAVLRYLAEHPGRLVTKDALLDAVWADTVVSEAALSVCIRELRQALGDDARAPVHRDGAGAWVSVHSAGYDRRPIPSGTPGRRL